MKKAFVYARTSKDEEKEDRVKHINQEDSATIEVQLDLCQKYAHDRDIEIIDVFTDQNWSGSLYPAGFETLAKEDDDVQKYIEETKLKLGKQFRPALGEMLSRLKEVDYIICDRSSRLMRPIADSMLPSIIIFPLKKNNVEVLYVKGGTTNYSDSYQSAVAKIAGIFSTIEKEAQRKNVKERLQKIKYQGGIYRNPTMYGFKSKGRFSKDVLPDLEMLQMVKECYEMFLSGVKLSKICFTMQEKYKKPILMTLLKTILKRPLYCGHYIDKQGVPRESPVYMKYKVISLAQWNQVQEIFRNKKKHFKSRENYYPLSGYVYCNCGEENNPMTVTIGKDRDGIGRHRYYRCMKEYLARTKKNIKCRKSSVKVQMEKCDKTKVGTALNECLKPFMMLALLERMENKKRQAEIQDKIASLEVELRNVKNKETFILKRADTLDEDQLDEITKDTTAKKQAILNELAKYKEKNSLAEDTITKHMMKTDAYFDTLTVDEYKLLAPKVFRKIVMYPDKIKVVLTNGGTFDIKRIKYSNQSLLPHSEVMGFRKDEKTGAYGITIDLRYPSYAQGDEDWVEIYNTYNVIVRVWGQ